MSIQYILPNLQSSAQLGGITWCQPYSFSSQTLAMSFGLPGIPQAIGWASLIITFRGGLLSATHLCCYLGYRIQSVCSLQRTKTARIARRYLYINSFSASETPLDNPGHSKAMTTTMVSQSSVNYVLLRLQERSQRRYVVHHGYCFPFLLAPIEKEIRW